MLSTLHTLQAAWPGQRARACAWLGVVPGLGLGVGVGVGLGLGLGLRVGVKGMGSGQAQG